MTKAKLKAKSHILSLLGNELIGSDALAIFELVKNAYDADASKVDIIFEGIGTENQKLTIRDNGHGMTKDVIEEVWLTLGTDFKRGVNRKESKKGRVSLGNKGVGRLAVHKIASNIDLRTKVYDSKLINHLSFNWQKLIDNNEFIQDIEVELDSYKDDENYFSYGQGTEIILTGFKEKKWNKTKIRDFYRKVNSIKSPFKSIKNDNDEFDIIVDLDDKNSWIENIHKPEDILKKAVYKFEFSISKSSEEDFEEAVFSWKYNFNDHDIANEKFRKRTVIKEDDKLDIKDLLNEYYESSDEDKKRNLINADLDGVGKIQGEFYAYNLNTNIVSLFFQNEKKAIKEFIKDNYGVRIYRDGVRVFNYGETSDDWLGLDYQKIQRAGDHFSRKVTLGAINLPLEASNETLIEKTNREGFIENDYYEILKIIVLEVFRVFERESRGDKELIQEYIDGFKPVKKAGLSETIVELEEKIEAKGLKKEFEPLIARVQKDYDLMKDVMVQSGMSGLNLSIIFHEVDRELRDIDKRLEQDSTNLEIEDVKLKVKSLVSVIDTFTPLLKSTKLKKFRILDLIKRTHELNTRRFESHNIIFSSPILTNEVSDFEIYGKSNLVFSAINNIIDNSIYFLGYNEDGSEKAIHITTDTNSFNGKALIITDNGPGFNLDSDIVVQPFVTSKESSMGIGLYLSDIVMESMGGKLLIVDSSDYEVPEVYTGACIALVFPEEKV